MAEMHDGLELADATHPPQLREAVARKISYATKLPAAEASVKAIRSLKNPDLTVKSLQEYHG